MTEYLIQLTPVANQRSDFNFGEDNYTIEIRTLKSGILVFGLYRSIDVDGESIEQPVARSVIAHNNFPILINDKLIDGNFYFRDTQGNSDPTFDGLGNRYQLIFRSNV